MQRGKQIRQRMRRRGTALAGLLALGVHLAAFCLAAVMPITTAIAAAEAEPFEIVICTIHGPVTMDARDLGMDVDGNLPEMPRTACDLAMQATAAIANDALVTTVDRPVTYEDTRVTRVTDTAPVYAAPRMRSTPPRAPPHTS